MAQTVLDEVALREPRLLVGGNQPLGLVRVDLTHPLARGLAFAWIPTFADLVKNAAGTPTLAAMNVVGGKRVLTVQRQTSAGLSFGLVQPLQGSSWTVVVRADPAPSGTERRTLFSQRSAGTGVPQINLLANVSGALSASYGEIEFYYRNTSGTGFYAHSETGTDIVNGAMRTFGATKQQDPEKAVIYVDGNAVTTTTDAGTPTGTYVTTAQETKIGNLGVYTADAAYAGNANFEFCYCWNRALSELEMMLVHASPYEFLIPA